MDYRVEKRDDVAILYLKGRLLGEHQTINLNEEIEEYIEDEVVDFIVDLSDLEFLNSTGLNFLLTLLTKGRRENGEVVLCDLNTHLSNLLITTKLNSFFTITDTLQEALDHFASERSSS